MTRTSARFTANRTVTVRQILAARGLNFGELCRLSRSTDSRWPLSPIPKNLSKALRRRGFSPSFQEIFTLSILTGYRLSHWLALFGFSLDDVARFQALFPTSRTVEIDARIYDTNHCLPWFRELRAPDLAAPLMPLSRWLGLALPRTLQPIPYGANPSCRFVKIGSCDAFAFPSLLPGSIVRVRSRLATETAKQRARSRQTLFLVEHNQGLVVTHLGFASPGKFVLCSRHLPYAPVELHEGSEAAIRGVIDLELRPVTSARKPLVPPRLARFWKPSPLAEPSAPRNVGEFIRRARIRCGLSFREASGRTRVIANTLRDRRYYCAPGTLSDFEAKANLPRYVHKIISICAVYFASPAEMLKLAGLDLATAGNDLLPAMAPREIGTATPSAFLRNMEKRFGPVPYFLANSLGPILGVSQISPRDVFWAGRLRAAKKSGLEGALFLAVDRKQKVPRPALSSPVSEQPIYVLLERGGSYLCGFCSLENGVLIVRPCAKGLPRILRFRNRTDAEVVGRVVGVIRRPPVR